MAAPGLGGAAMAAPVMGYDAIAVLEEEQHLRVPVIGRQRPAVAEHDGLTFAPVLVIDVSAIFRRDCVHGVPFLCRVGCGGSTRPPIGGRRRRALSKCAQGGYCSPGLAGQNVGYLS